MAGVGTKILLKACAPPRDAGEIAIKLESMLHLPQCQAVYKNQFSKCESAASKQLK